MELIGEHLGQDLGDLESYEVYFGEGSKGELRFYVENPLSLETIEQLEAEICSQGVYLTGPIEQVSRVVIIPFEKRIAPLLIIAGVVGAVVVGLLGWQIWKMTVLGIPLWVIGIGGIALLYLLFRTEPAKKAGGLAIQAGKVYVTKKVAK